jgi:acyl-CoA thioester hydrolase
MERFKKNVQLRWSDLDPNFHLRHSVYYDWGAFCRIEFLNENGLTAEVMQSLNFGPILFREECIFKREIRSGDQIEIDLAVLWSKKDFSRWSFRHQVTKNGGETLCAILTVEGAWMDTTKRKLAAPPEQISRAFENMPKTSEFEWR